MSCSPHFVSEERIAPAAPADTPPGGARCLIVPGLHSSGPDHWQAYWERGRGDCRRVDAECWDDPVPERWVAVLDRAIRATPGRPILVAHSLGCITVGLWAAGVGRERMDRIGGALLVAPPDVDRPGADPRLRRFAPTPAVPFAFPTILVASRDDPYATPDRSRAMAAGWGARFVDAGLAGHINAQSQLGNWLIGQRLLDRLIDCADQPVATTPSPIPIHESSQI